MYLPPHTIFTRIVHSVTSKFNIPGYFKQTVLTTVLSARARKKKFIVTEICSAPVNLNNILRKTMCTIENSLSNKCNGT